jgi:predicted O-methyltransferase YrrM
MAGRFSDIRAVAKTDYCIILPFVPLLFLRRTKKLQHRENRFMPMPLTRLLKNRGRLLLRSIFELGQRFGVDILPRHFYSEIPDMRVLRGSTQWKMPRSFWEVQGDLDAQVAWVDACTKSYRDGLKNFDVHRAAVAKNGSSEGYGEVETDFLYCFVRAQRPAQILQIGCGVSTAVCLRAAEDEGYTPRLICIVPHPTEFLKQESEAGRIKLLTKKVEEVGSECARWLGSGDLFFVDSSHTLSPAGEVNLIVLEMLPRLAAGTFAHFHDISFPYDYSPNMLSSELFFQHESALLYAFLLMNDHFEIAASLSMLHHLRLDELRRFFPAMRPSVFEEGLLLRPGHYPSSIFLSRRE